MDTNTSLADLAIVAKRIDNFDIRQKKISQKLNDIQICSLTFSYKTDANLRLILLTVSLYYYVTIK